MREGEDIELDTKEYSGESVHTDFFTFLEEQATFSYGISPEFFLFLFLSMMS